MDNEQEILKTLKEISGRMDAGFKGIEDAIADLERRIAKQEKKSRKAAKQQDVQADEIRKLKKIVRSLAESDGHKRSDGTAIYKEPAYAEFEKCGIEKRAAMKELRDAGAIKTDSEGKTTCAVRIDGKLRRLIIVLD